MEGAISQLHSLRNGYSRPSNTIPRQNNKQQNWAGPMNYTMQMVDPSALPTNLRKNAVATGSDSGGSSTGEASPPPNQPDPSATGLHGNANQTQSSGSLRNKQPLTLSRLNGGKHGAGGSSATGANNNNNNIIDINNGSQSHVGTLVASNSSGNLSLLIGGQMHNFPGYRTISPQLHQQQRHFHIGQSNGELIYAFNTPFLPAQAPVVVANTVSQRASPSAVAVPTPYPANKMVQSCFNCGSTSHTGLSCSEFSMEDMTRNAGYKLDYTANTPTQIQFMPTLTSSTSTSSLNQATSGSPSVNNNEGDPSITFIDLTQDTTSSSSSSTSSIHGAK